MRTEKQIQEAVAKLANVAEFARKHKVPARTVWSVRAKNPARRGTLALLNAALDADRGRAA
jgi:hypothetical protein